MKLRSKVKFTPDGKAAFEKIISIWPPIIRERKEEKIFFVLSLIMERGKIKTADQKLVIEATRHVVPKSYDPFFHMLEDMEKFKKKMLEPFQSMDAYNKMHIEVKRWKRTAGKRNRGSPQLNNKVLAFCASPRKNGNTDILIEEALKGARDAGAETEKIMLQKVKIEYCIGCRKCKDPGYEKICILNDDMTEIYRKINDAGAIIIGFPIYTGREAAQLSTFFDRWDGYERYMLQSFIKPGRIAMVIGTWGYPYIDTYDHVIETVISILNLHKVEAVEALSACGFEGILHGLDSNRKGVISKFSKELKKAYDAGASLAKRIR